MIAQASSPSLNLDKSLTSLKPPRHANVLAAHKGAGINKPSKKGGKVLTRKQKLRLEQGREKAEERMGKMEVKVERVGRRRENVGKRNVSG